jgi:hypothetical protein
MSETDGIKVLLAAFPLSRSATSYFRERKDRVTPAATAEIMGAKIVP